MIKNCVLLPVAQDVPSVAQGKAQNQFAQIDEKKKRAKEQCYNRRGGP